VLAAVLTTATAAQSFAVYRCTASGCDAGPFDDLRFSRPDECREHAAMLNGRTKSLTLNNPFLFECMSAVVS
jgi:hypothetical protein